MGKRNGRQDREEYELYEPQPDETTTKVATVNRKPHIPSQVAFAQVTHRKKRRVLDALVMTAGNVTRACMLANCSQSNTYKWIRDDPEFSKLWAIAQGMANKALEDEAIRRGFQGYRIPVGWHKGKPGAFVTQYSDTLLIFMLKGAFPDKYADRQEVKGQFAHIDWSQLPDEALSRIANGEHPTSVLASLAARYEPDAPALPPGQPIDVTPGQRVDGEPERPDGEPGSQ